MAGAAPSRGAAPLPGHDDRPRRWHALEGHRQLAVCRNPHGAGRTPWRGALADSDPRQGEVRTRALLPLGAPIATDPAKGSRGLVVSGAPAPLLFAVAAVLHAAPLPAMPFARVDEVDGTVRRATFPDSLAVDVDKQVLDRKRTGVQRNLGRRLAETNGASPAPARWTRPGPAPNVPPGWRGRSLPDRLCGTGRPECAAASTSCRCSRSFRAWFATREQAGPVSFRKRWAREGSISFANSANLTRSA